MDTYIQAGDGTAAGPAKSAAKRQHRTVAEKRRIVEETLVEGASVARIARAHGVNANQVFYWRTLYRKGRLDRQSKERNLPCTRPRLCSSQDGGFMGTESGDRWSNLSNACSWRNASLSLTSHRL